MQLVEMPKEPETMQTRTHDHSEKREPGRELARLSTAEKAGVLSDHV